ncbi:hypothetical protein [Ramlibacter albus]|uniref:Uncharacterized protein n=1 Tax=Ramlibacter albus TaxID=2079448 RepID=A0A923MDX3_9BURK|nr:hypothetical protein [Ramlibacter albus]MBC5767649.1 hypothetical protein [Ramlibacter albus]
MKNIIQSFCGLPWAQRAIVIAEAVALVTLLLVVPGPAKAQSGDVYAPSQAQVSGQVFEATVVQVSLKEVEASTTARLAGGAVGSTVAIALGSRAKGDSRFAVQAVSGVLGGLLGERGAHMVAGTHAQEVVVLIAQPVGGPRLQVIVQPAPYQAVTAGEAVYVTVISGTYRVIKRTS